MSPLPPLYDSADGIRRRKAAVARARHLVAAHPDHPRLERLRVLLDEVDDRWRRLSTPICENEMALALAVAAERDVASWIGSHGHDDASWLPTPTPEPPIAAERGGVRQQSGKDAAAGSDP